MKGKIVAISIVAMLFLGMLAIFPAYAPDQVYILPSSLDLTGKSLGYRFDVAVYGEIADPPALFTWQVKLTFPDWLNAIAAGYCNPTANVTHPHDWTKSEMFHGKPTVPVSPIIDNTPGAKYVLHGESLMGADKASGNKALMWVIFEIVAVPQKLGSLDGAIDSNNAKTFFLDPGLGSVPITKGRCDLIYNWQAPATKPHMGWYVDPIGTGSQPNPVWDQSKNWTCTNVDKEVLIKNLDAAWGLTTASFVVNIQTDAYLTYVSCSLKPGWVGAAIWDGVSTITVSVTWVGPPPVPSGDVPVLDIILHIEVYPEYPWPGVTYVDTIPTGSVFLENHIGPISVDPSETCTQKLFGYLKMLKPDMEVGDVSVGPGPAVCTTIDVPVSIKNLDKRWQLIGIQFRLGYKAPPLPCDQAIVEPVCATEGPYLDMFAHDRESNTTTPEQGTYFIVYHEPDDFGPHTLIGDMILPNSTGRWIAPFPGGSSPDFINGSGVVAIIHLHIIKDLWPDGLTMPLHLFDILLVGLDDQQNIIEIPVGNVKDGTLTIWHTLPGRVIDVYGGMECHVFPAPYGGQGANNPMDIVYPQKEVCLHVEVTYNYWPVQQKDVGFEIEGPYWHGTNIKKNVTRPFLLKLTNRTDADGHTWVKFRLPWYCDNPDEMLGEYKVWATVDIACVVVNDTLRFDFDYVQRFWKVVVTPPECKNELNFPHCAEVEIAVDFGTRAQQTYPDLLVVVIYDELGVPIGMAMVEMEIGGAVWCQYKNYTAKVKIHIPKWAFVGIAKIHVMCFNKDPTEGGIPWCPEFTPYPEIFITPY